MTEPQISQRTGVPYVNTTVPAAGFAYAAAHTRNKKVIMINNSGSKKKKSPDDPALASVIDVPAKKNERKSYYWIYMKNSELTSCEILKTG